MEKTKSKYIVYRVKVCCECMHLIHYYHFTCSLCSRIHNNALKHTVAVTEIGRHGGWKGNISHQTNNWTIKATCNMNKFSSWETMLCFKTVLVIQKNRGVPAGRQPINARKISYLFCLFNYHKFRMNWQPKFPFYTSVNNDEKNEHSRK